ncbi:MAG: helix-turn-helix transcriptional regulator [Armatimonadota bacterium]|nr:helix-turn-helix transcriptional regulator [Armatimonadota bacterium]MDR7404329.1 helix-turn-helix transcriptional regulator [Armatimonadota bacterium]
MTDPRGPRAPQWLKRLGSRIRLARRVSGLTQTDIARPNLTKSFISLLESGRTYPSVSTLVALADRLQTSLALLVLDPSQLPRETTLNLLALARSAATAPAQAERLLVAAEALAGETPDLQAELLLARADVAATQGRPRDAERILREGLAWVRRRALTRYEPRILSRLASLSLGRGDEDAARQNLEDALAAFRTTRTLRSLEGCEALLSYGEVLGRRGRPGRAQRIFEEVIQVARRQDLPVILGRAHLALARLHLAGGRQPQALAALRAAREVLLPVEDGAAHASALQLLGRLLAEVGEVQEAHQILSHARAAAERTGDARTRAAVLDDLARVLIRMGKVTEAHRHAREALALAEAHKDAAQRARCLATLGRVAKAQRRWKAAVDHLRQAVDLFGRLRLTAELGETARELGMLLRERGDHAAAAEYLSMAVGSAPGGGRPPDDGK